MLFGFSQHHWSDFSEVEYASWQLLHERNRVSLPEKHREVILEFKAVVEQLQSPLLLQLILVTIPEKELDVVYELVHVRQRQDVLKTHLDRDKDRGAMFNTDMSRRFEASVTMV